MEPRPWCRSSRLLQVPTTLADFRSPLPEWKFANVNGIAHVGAGPTTAGTFYSFGSASSDERALSDIGSASSESNGFGRCVVNFTGATLTTITVSFDEEEWRNGENFTPQALTFASRPPAPSRKLVSSPDRSPQVHSGRMR